MDSIALNKGKEQGQGKIIYLSDLWEIFLKRWWIMLLAAVVVGAGMFVYQKASYVPQYRCKAILYILNYGEDNKNTTPNFSLSSSLLGDCTYFLKCHEVLEKVIEETGADISYAQLYGMVSTYNPSDTRILEVTVLAKDPYLAKTLVDEVCELGSAKITESFGFQQTNFCEKGVLDLNPFNTFNYRNIIIGALAGAVAVYALFFLIYFLDDSLATNEEIEKVLGITILGEVPNFDGGADSKYGYRKYGRKYYRYGRYGRYGYSNSKSKVPDKTKEGKENN